MFTFAILGHNEAATIASAVSAARAAAAPADRVIAVDSGSDDGTAAAARRAGAEVLSAPAGKGRAMAAVVTASDSPWICFLDADLPGGGVNYPAVLRDAAARGGADQVLGEFDAVSGGMQSGTYAVYEPLVAALFPEAAGRFGARPLTGFRAVRRAFLRPEEFPPGFGIEAHLNLSVLLAGGTHLMTPLGPDANPFRYKPFMSREIAAGVLDCAQRAGRLSPARRPEWDAWAEEAVAVISQYRGTAAERPAFTRQLARLAGRPYPAAR